MTLVLPFALIPDQPDVQANFETISLAWPASVVQVSTYAAGTTSDVAIASTDAVIRIEWALEFTALCELRMNPNAVATAIYSEIRDGSYETSAPAAIAVAAAGAVNHNNGIRLVFAPQVAVAGGMQATGSAIFSSMIPTVGGRRTCMGQTTVTSLTGSNNHVIELQNIASLFNSNVALTSLRFACSAGTMTGRIRVTRA